MTRLGPLTSQALGRSPYDIVVQGEGEADPREPTQHYDERGRPINAETKRINRDIVRSHNEVMQVIGVAEPDSGMMSADAESDKRLLQQHFEDYVGQGLWPRTRFIGVVGVWGADPLRQRVLLYRRYCEYLPWRNFRQDYGPRALFDALTRGLPLALIDNLIYRFTLNRASVPCGFWETAFFKFVRVHLQAYLCLQRLSIVPSFPWVPAPLFFVPFSSQSPISLPPPLPTEFSVSSMLQWTGQALLKVAPLAVFFAYTELREWLEYRLDHIIFDAQNVPSNPPLRRPFFRYDPSTGERRLAGLPAMESFPPRPPVPPPPQPPPARRPSIPPPPSESERLFSDPEDSRRNAIDAQAAEIAMEAVANVALASSAPGTQLSQQQEQRRRSFTPAPESPTVSRRRNTVSSGGGDDGYISEEEEFELSATLISFDVEAADAGDTPPNAWSAELRQSSSTNGYEADAAGTFGSPFAQGTYIRSVYYPGDNGPFHSDTMLSRLPAAVHAASSASVATSIVLVEVEAFAVRLLARTYRARNGLPMDDLFGLPWLLLGPGGMSWNLVTHFTTIVLMESVVNAVGVLVAAGLGYLYHGSQLGWSFSRVVKEKLWRSKEKNDKGKEREG